MFCNIIVIIVGLLLSIEKGWSTRYDRVTLAHGVTKYELIISTHNTFKRVH